MAVTPTLEAGAAAEVKAQENKTPEAKPERGAAARKTLAASVEAAAKATEEVNAGLKGEGEKKPEEKKVSRETPEAKAKNEAEGDGGADPLALREAHLKKREAEFRAEVKAEQEKLAKAREAGDGKKTDDSKAKAASKFEVPALEMPDWDKIGEDEDAIPHVKKAFESMQKAFTATVSHLLEKIEEMGGSLGEVREFADGMSQAQANRFQKALASATTEAKGLIDEEYDIDEFPESIMGSFVKMWKADLIDCDPHSEVPDAKMLVKAWRLDNADLLEQHRASKNGKKEEAAPEKKNKPTASSGASGGSGDGGAGLKGADKVRATLLKHNPHLR